MDNQVQTKAKRVRPCVPFVITAYKLIKLHPPKVYDALSDIVLLLLVKTEQRQSCPMRVKMMIGGLGGWIMGRPIPLPTWPSAARSAIASMSIVIIINTIMLS